VCILVQEFVSRKIMFEEEKKTHEKKGKKTRVFILSVSENSVGK